MSSLTWIDGSNAEAERVRRVLALFDRPEALDELGLGSIRDTLSDLLFPGTSTIQTRLRYMLFVPWIYARLSPSLTARPLAAELRKEESRLIDALRVHRGETGIIGIEAGIKVRRLASEIYWGGLGTWGIRTFAGSQAVYHRARSGLTMRAWAAELPNPPQGFPDKADLVLTAEEKTYLHDRLAMLSSQDGPVYLSLVATHGGTEAGMPWQHPAQKRAPVHVRRILEQARLFSAVMFGATLLYKSLLARLCALETAPEFEEDFLTWASGSYEGAEFLPDEIANWDLEQLRRVAVHPTHRIAPLAWEFVGRWLQLARGNRARLLDSQEAALLITLRESSLKQRRARLSEPEARSGWLGRTGYAPLNFRWNLVRRYLADFSA